MSLKTILAKSPPWVRVVLSRTRYRRILYLFGILALWMCIVPPVYLTFLRQGGKSDTLESFRTSQSPDYIDITLVAQSASLTQHKLDMYVEVTPHGSFKQGYTELTTNITGYFGEKNVNFKAGKRMQSFDLKVPLMGYPRLFPFDNYDTLFEVYLKSGDKANEAPVPLHITIFGSVQTLDFHTAITRPNPDDHTVLFTIQTNRTAITVVFSIYIMTVMWCLAITISTLAFQIAVSRRQVPPGLLVSGVSMMFALPALRNAQPGIPSLGCASDALAFFWCIIIVAFCAVNNILLSVVRVEKKRKPAPEPEPAPESPRTKKRNSLIFPVVVADVEHAPAE